MSKVKTAHINILEASTVTLSAGTEDTDYPLARLYDRNVGRMFRPTAAETIEVKADQGAGSPEAVDRLLIPAGHNLSGMTLDILHSPDDSSYTPAVTQWTGADGLIVKSWQPLQKRYWKFRITSPSSVPELAELFLTSSYEWARNPSRPAGRLDRVFNVERAETASGKDRFMVRGAPRRVRSYTIPGMGDAQKDELLGLNEGWAGSKPFWLYDHEGGWIYGTLTEPMDITEAAFSRYSAVLEFREVIN
jgi:hypothetical protein